MHQTRQDQLDEDTGGATAGRHAWWAIDAASGGAVHGVVGIGFLDPGIDSGMHRHGNAEEAMIVLEGEGVVRTSDGETPAREGTILYAPRGVWHGLRAGESGLRLLIVYGGPNRAAAVEFESADTDTVSAEARPAGVLQMWDVQDNPFHDPAQGFLHLSARWLVDADHLGSDAIVLGQSTFGAGKGAHELHRHPGAEEFLYLLSGAGAHLTGDGTEVPVHAGDFTFAARGEWHGFRNRGEEPALAIFGYLGAASLAAGGYELPATATA